MVSQIDKESAVTQQLRIIFRAIQAHSKRVENACGLSSVRLWMLHEVNNNPGIRVSELATALSIHRSTCSNMLDKLEDRNLVYRNRSKSDQRAVRLYLSEEGKAVLQKAPSPPEGKLSSGLSKLSQKELAELESSLGKLVEALQFDDEKAPLTPVQ